MKQKPTNSTTIGANAESAARNYLQQQGLTFIDANYRFKGGEIDLIMSTTDAVLVFIEVRLRNHSGYGSGAESITYRKQQRISRTAQHYLQCNPQQQERALRFDVISAVQRQGQYQFEGIQQAFWPGDNY